VTDEPWERFAREDAEYYVLADIGGDRGAQARPTMLSKLEENAARDAAASHIQSMLASDAWDNPNNADLVYSVLVFQHIEHLRGNRALR
jgi:hypothetical protein